MEKICRNEKETFKLAKKFAKTLKGGEIVLFYGDLGAGKTTFTKGVAKALKIKEPITSPTFTIVNEYHSGKIDLYHFDMYRLEDESEAFEIGIKDYFNKNGICLIEWPERIINLLPKHYIKVNIDKLDDNTRRFLIENI